MFRKCLNSLLILGYLASQLAAIPHAHGGMSAAEQQEHAATPHFHCHGTGHSHTHTHECQHDHQGPTKAGIDGEKKPVATSTFTASGFNHDADAVFLPSGISVVVSSQPDNLLLATSLGVASINIVSLLEIPPDNSSGRTCGHISDCLTDNSDLYLTLRQLRI